jgi:hypothetical protein
LRPPPEQQRELLVAPIKGALRARKASKRFAIAVSRTTRHAASARPSP